MPTNWEDRDDMDGLPAFVIAALARYEDGIRTEIIAENAEAIEYEQLEAAKGYAEASRVELISLLDFFVGRLEGVAD